MPRWKEYRGPQALLLHGKCDSAAGAALLPLGVQAGQGVPVPPGHSREVDEIVMQRLLLHTLYMHKVLGSFLQGGGGPVTQGRIGSFTGWGIKGCGIWWHTL